MLRISLRENRVDGMSLRVLGVNRFEIPVKYIILDVQ